MRIHVENRGHGRIQWLTVVGAFSLDAVAVRVLVVGRDSQDAADAVSVGSGRRRMTRCRCRCMGYHRHGTTWSRLTLLLTLLLLRLLLLMRVLRLLRRFVPHDSTDNASKRAATCVCIELLATVIKGFSCGFDRKFIGIKWRGNSWKGKNWRIILIERDCNKSLNNPR